MRRVLLSLILCVQSVSMSAASGHVVFHTASFGSSRSVSLGLAGGGPAFDFDVVITLSEFDGGGTVIYRDGGRHEASVRCVSPAMVRINSADYTVDVSARSGTDWKHDLWAALCTAPVS
ncbi:hypothetical protein GR223_36915 [Rhizobium leguminosarum]|uniref:hypothetical protein n=1 Tax=Rhizobium ruizarguesonis TaxID=2081791 RepID=UPI0013DF0C92|nr:hypothetical protein [Rhizobium ruizarguesonis]NEJ91447.1 hypothetical protein [Rhizobium ruizarguesonis]